MTTNDMISYFGFNFNRKSNFDHVNSLNKTEMIWQKIEFLSINLNKKGRIIFKGTYQYYFLDMQLQFHQIFGFRYFILCSKANAQTLGYQIDRLGDQLKNQTCVCFFRNCAPHRVF